MVSASLKKIQRNSMFCLALTVHYDSGTTISHQIGVVQLFGDLNRLVHYDSGTKISHQIGVAQLFGDLNRLVHYDSGTTYPIRSEWSSCLGI
ncbi:hypothetical protein AVEN_102880-1 [Araneus ventricosus]|uniref:Uncharacterized protein n=1 Tax=Araneus ventricosus TaxID=182803 RepID=A0A4Y2C611_ARAVE|nr:hypothetical protein AVEN_102880-1 [Araneus ventricosus]